MFLKSITGQESTRYNNFSGCYWNYLKSIRFNRNFRLSSAATVYFHGDEVLSRTPLQSLSVSPLQGFRSLWFLQGFTHALRSRRFSRWRMTHYLHCRHLHFHHTQDPLWCSVLHRAPERLACCSHGNKGHRICLWSVFDDGIQLTVCLLDFIRFLRGRSLTQAGWGPNPRVPFCF